VEVKILGARSPKWKRLEQVTRQELGKTAVKAAVTKATRLMDILSYRIPAPRASFSMAR
jgi:hypothetical protein